MFNGYILSFSSCRMQMEYYCYSSRLHKACRC
jgi:hypothetical protein